MCSTTIKKLRKLTNLKKMEEIYISKLLNYLEEDVFPEDISSKIVEGKEVRAQVITKDNGLIAGLKFLRPFLKTLGLTIKYSLDDGKEMRRGDIVIEYKGEASVILSSERLLLNFLGRLSGIATATNEMVLKARKVNPKVIIASTRKTTPGFRVFEKYAVRIGGGDPHRFNLSDCVLIKDNHIAIVGSIGKAVKMAKEINSFTKKVEVEVSSLEGALEAYKAGADIILLDNMRPHEIKEVVAELKGKVLLEASGGINPNNVEEFASTGVDVISSGYLTHSSRALDMSLDVYTS